MIKISVDESDAFDRISILEVKKDKAESRNVINKLTKDITNLEQEINEAISFDKAIQIYKSVEYCNLKNINKEIYELIDIMNSSSSYVDAKTINNLNYQRFLAKKALQEKFFGELNEIKVGYID